MARRSRRYLSPICEVEEKLPERFTNRHLITLLSDLYNNLVTFVPTINTRYPFWRPPPGRLNEYHVIRQRGQQCVVWGTIFVKILAGGLLYTSGQQGKALFQEATVDGGAHRLNPGG
jgi:hypothetical protein